MRTPQEIEDKLDEMAYLDYCAAQGGNENTSGRSQLMMLNWLLGTSYDNLYERGEKVYKQGIRYKWDQNKREYKRIGKVSE